MTKTQGYAAKSATSPMESFDFERKELGPHDIQIEILYCGICHSDLHVVRNEWKNTIYPVVPGHEILGKVVKIGNQVNSFQIGDRAAIGCIINSCRNCPNCQEGLEQYCQNEFMLVFNSKDKEGNVNYGGFSKLINVDESYALHVPKKFADKDLPRVAPLLCAGITTYSPLRHWKVGKGSKVGIVGLGGLGHMAVKLAHAMGAHVVLFTTSPNKIEDAKRLGADEVIISKNTGEMKKHAASFDFILNTVAAPHNLDVFLELLKRDRTMCLVGLPAEPHPALNVGNLIFLRRDLAGSVIGGIKETQELLDFCADQNVMADVEIIPIQKINEGFDRMLKNDVKYRFVIDMSSLK